MKKQGLFRILCGVLLVVLMAISFGAGCATPTQTEPAPTTEEPIELSYADLFPPLNWWHSEVVIPFADRIEQASNGRIKVTLYAGGTLLKSGDIYSGVEEGIADMGREAASAQPGVLPLCEIMDLPGIGYSSGQAVCHAKWETYKALEPWEEFSKVHVLYISTAVPYVLASTRPVYTLEDFEGMEIRSMGAVSNWVKVLGGVPVELALDELYEGLQKNVVDGYLSSAATLKAWKFAEQTSAVTLLPLPATTFPWVMNAQKWDSLPKDLQKVVTDSSYQVIDEAKIFDQKQIEAIEYAKSVQPDWVTIILSDDEAARWSERLNQVAVEGVAGVEAKGLPGQKVYDELQKQTKKYNEIYPSQK